MSASGRKRSWRLGGFRPKVVAYDQGDSPAFRLEADLGTGSIEAARLTEFGSDCLPDRTNLNLRRSLELRAICRDTSRIHDRTLASSYAVDGSNG